GGDMHVFPNQVLRKVPQGTERRIRQAQAPIRPEDRNALREAVERLTLDTYNGVVTALQIEFFGQILEDPGHPALGLGIGDDTERATVRQMPPMLLRFDGTVSRQKLLLPAPPLGLLGELALAAQPVEHERVFRHAFQKGGIKIPELLEGLIEE